MHLVRWQRNTAKSHMPSLGRENSKKPFIFLQTPRWARKKMVRLEDKANLSIPNFRQDLVGATTVITAVKANFTCGWGIQTAENIQKRALS